MRAEFPKIVEDLMLLNDKIYVMLGDIGHYGFQNVEKKFPERFYNMGIAEQALIGIGAGMALEGKIPILHSIAPFVVERAFEQIKIDLCYQHQEVIIVSVGASFDYSHLGYTHHCPNDISILSTLPNLEIYTPGNSLELREILFKKTGNGNPKYIKLNSESHDEEFEDSLSFRLISSQENSKQAIIFTGHTFKFTKSLNFHNVDFYYCNNLQFKLTTKEKEKLASYEDLIVVEENYKIGGFSSYIEEEIGSKVRNFGLPKKVIDKYGSKEELANYLGFTHENLIRLL